MTVRSLMVLSVMLWLQMANLAAAETSPARTVQQFIEAHLQGRFAESRGFALERINLSASLFSNWLFGTAGTGTSAPTADVFLSRKFTQAFRYNLTGTTPNGDNQVTVSAVRTSPNIMHMYTWALAPKRGAAPYELIDAIDTYLSKVNYPLEESRLHFTLIREAGEWYISAVQDEKFQQLQQQQVLFQQPLSMATAPLSSGAPAAAPVTSEVATPVPPTASAPPTAPAPPTASAPVATTTSEDEGRRLADAQFNATMQSFNYAYQPPPEVKQAKTQEDDDPSLLNRVGKLFGFGGKSDGEILANISDKRLRTTFNEVRDALARYAARSNGYVPDRGEIYDWPSLRQVVNLYGKKSLPATETDAGFRFLRYRTDSGRGDYTLLVELVQPQDGLNRVEITPYGVDRAN
jgi:hypothetical protein